MKQVYVVEDDIAMRQLYQYQLQSDQWRLRIYGSGPELFRDLDSGEPDLLILDMGLPGMSGLEILKSGRLKARQKSYPIIVITSQDCPSLRDEVFEYGATAVFGKPFSPSILRKRISELLARPS